MYAPLFLISVLDGYVLRHACLKIHEVRLTYPVLSAHMSHAYPCDNDIILYISLWMITRLSLYTYLHMYASLYDKRFLCWYTQCRIYMNISLWSDLHTPSSPFMRRRSISEIRLTCLVLSTHKHAYVSDSINMCARLYLTSLLDEIHTVFSS